ncbi:hypothetical protein FKM82_020282 [Ascaphus truei]
MSIDRAFSNLLKNIGRSMSSSSSVGNVSPSKTCAACLLRLELSVQMCAYDMDLDWLLSESSDKTSIISCCHHVSNVKNVYIS